MLFRADDHVIGGFVLETIGGDDPKCIRHVAEPEAACIEQMRSKIRKHACAFIAPNGIMNEPRGAVAVKHPARIDFPERSRGN